MRQWRFSKAQGEYCNDDKSTGRKERKMGQDVISFRLIFLFIQLRGGNMALITTLSGIPWYVHVGIGRTLLMFSRNKAGKKMPKNMEEFFLLQYFQNHFVKVFEFEFGHDFKENIFKPFPGIRKRKGASLGSGTNRVSYLPTNYILFPALNVFLQLSTNLTYLMPIDLVVLFDIGVVSITGNLFYNLCFLSEIF